MKIAYILIKNFRSISGGLDGEGLRINLEDKNVVFLIGKNNIGKSTILQAYEYFVAAEQTAQADDFHGGPSLNEPISIEIGIRAESEADRQHQALVNWLDPEDLARYKKVWQQAGEKGEKFSFDPTTEQWCKNGAGGFDSILQNACPTPLWLRGDAAPAEIVSQIQTLVKEKLIKRSKELKSYSEASDALRRFQAELMEDEYARAVETRIGSLMREVFPAVNVALVNEGETDFLKQMEKQTTIRLVDRDHPAVGLDNHGHGMRRQFIFNTLRGLNEVLANTKKKGVKKDSDFAIVDKPMSETKTTMLLFEEPELYLHPQAMRSVRDMIYSLAENSEFQIMTTTHAPIVIDLCRPQVTLVRVVNSPVHGTVAYQVDSDAFEAEEKDWLRMVHKFDPHVCEAFFADRVILVEGDTEAMTIRLLVTRLIEAGKLNEVDAPLVVNCGSKMTIPFYQRVLRHFRIEYFVIHDLDSTHTEGGKKKNPAWRLNETIWNEISEARNAGVNARRFVMECNFEDAHSYTVDPQHGKPYSAYLVAKGWSCDDLSIPFMRALHEALGLASQDKEFDLEWVVAQATTKRAQVG